MSEIIYRIEVRGTLSNKGFGFWCMRTAFQNNLTGTIFYLSENAAILEISGKEGDIIETIDHYRGLEYISKIKILDKYKTGKKFNDFIMLNQID